MHVGLIIDEERLLHEHLVLNRLSLGLVDEGAKFTRFVPDRPAIEGFDDIERRVSLIATRVDVPMKVAPWMRRARARQIAAALEKAVPDVLVAYGSEAWPVATSLGNATQRPVVLDVWSLDQARAVPNRRAAAAVSAYLAPTAPIAEELRRRVDPGLVTVIRTGVSVPRHAREILSHSDRSVSLAIIGGGRDVSSYRAMLAGLSLIVREMPHLQAAIELRGRHAHDIWREARRLELLSNLSAITDAAPLRALLTECDILLMPERYGEMRSLMLDAMANGMAIISADDPALDMLIDNETVAVVPEAETEAWARQMRKILNDPEHARQLGQGARDMVLAQHRSSDQVRHMLDFLDRVVTGDSIRFSDVRPA